MATKKPHNEFERALSFFIDPTNPEMKYDGFHNAMIRIVCGSNYSDSSNEYEKELKVGLQSVFEDVKMARRFNEKYLGHQLSDACIPGMLGYMLALRLGSNTVSREVSLQESNLEPEALNGLMSIVGYDHKKASGTFTSGGSLAIFTALLIARKKMQKEVDAIEKKPERMVVFSTDMAHYSLQKMVEYLGGPYQIIENWKIRTNNLKMSIEDLHQNIIVAKMAGIPIMAIFAIAGETETGLVDPLKEIASISKENNIFSIADGAFGAPYRNSKVGHLFEGIEEFDSIIIDGHKSLYTPYSNGAVLFKDCRFNFEVQL